MYLIKSENYPDITAGIKFINGNIGFENNIHTFPYFSKNSFYLLSAAPGSPMSLL